MLFLENWDFVTYWNFKLRYVINRFDDGVKIKKYWFRQLSSEKYYTRIFN